MSNPLSRLVLPFGLGVLTQFYKHMWPKFRDHIDEAADNTTTGFKPDLFVKDSFAANILGWSKSENFNADSAITMIRSLTKMPETIVALALFALNNKGVTGFGRTDYWVGPGHIYVYRTRPRVVPAQFRPYFLDLTSWWPLLAQLLFFPGGGRLIRPDQEYVPPPIDWNRDPDDIQSLLPHGQLTSQPVMLPRKPTDPLHGLVQLGNAQVWASGGGIIQTERLVVRYVLMSTSRWHIFDGEALWIQIYDRGSHEVMFLAVGAGRNPWQVVDDVNNHASGLVFGSKFHGFVTGMELIAGGHLHSALTHDEAGELPPERLLASADVKLAVARNLALWLNLGVPLGAFARSVVGPRIVGPPTTE
jgi:hypothetical protein